MRRLAALLIVALTLVSSPAHATEWGAWGPRGQAVNDFRGAHDRPPLDQRQDLQDAADAYADAMAVRGILRHSACVPDATDFCGENIGYGPDYKTIFNAWLASSCRDGTWDGTCPGHREMLLDRDFTQMGVGCHRTSPTLLWCVLRLR